MWKISLLGGEGASAILWDHPQLLPWALGGISVLQGDIILLRADFMALRNLQWFIPLRDHEFFENMTLNPQISDRYQIFQCQSPSRMRLPRNEEEEQTGLSVASHCFQIVLSLHKPKCPGTVEFMAKQPGSPMSMISPDWRMEMWHSWIRPF